MKKQQKSKLYQVLNFDIHLTKDFKGKRYVERITECIPVEDVNDYNYDYRNSEKTLEGKFERFADNTLQDTIQKKQIKNYTNM